MTRDIDVGIPSVCMRVWYYVETVVAYIIIFFITQLEHHSYIFFVLKQRYKNFML